MSTSSIIGALTNQEIAIALFEANIIIKLKQRIKHRNIVDMNAWQSMSLVDFILNKLYTAEGNFNAKWILSSELKLKRVNCIRCMQTNIICPIAKSKFFIEIVKFILCV